MASLKSGGVSRQATATRLQITAQGCRTRLPWVWRKRVAITLKGLRPPWEKLVPQRNPCGVGVLVDAVTQGSRVRQPWAVGCNHFVVAELPNSRFVDWPGSI